MEKNEECWSECFLWLSGRGLLHVGFMLWSDEWSHGYWGRQRTATSVWGQCWPLQICPQCGILHLPANQLREYWSCMQGLWSGLLSLQEEGRYLYFLYDASWSLVLWTIEKENVHMWIQMWILDKYSGRSTKYSLHLAVEIHPVFGMKYDLCEYFKGCAIRYRFDISLILLI